MSKFEKSIKPELPELFQEIGKITTPEGSKQSVLIHVIPFVGTVMKIGGGMVFLPDVNVKEENGVKKLIKERCWK